MALIIGFLGGTGPQGSGLARRLGLVGYPVILGSRDEDRARRKATELASAGIRAAGGSNQQVAKEADVVVIAVPWQGHATLLTALAPLLAGKVVVDCVNPLGFDEDGPFPLAVEEGSAAEQAAALLPDSTVVAAFHHLSAVTLLDPQVEELAGDVLVLGDDREGTDLVQRIIDSVPGLRGVYGGGLRNAHQVEALTANLIAVNKRYKVHAGLRISDV